MSTKTENTIEQGMVSRHFRLPESLDAWLSEYAAKNGYSTQQELLREIARDFRQSKLQANQERAA